MNNLVRAILSGEKVSVLDKEGWESKNTGIVQAIKSLPDESFLVIVLSPRDIKPLRGELRGCSNYHIVTCSSALKREKIAGLHPDIIILDEYIRIYSKLDYQIEPLKLALNIIKRDSTQLIRLN